MMGKGERFDNWIHSVLDDLRLIRIQETTAAEVRKLMADKVRRDCPGVARVSIRMLHRQAKYGIEDTEEKEGMERVYRILNGTMTRRAEWRALQAAHKLTPEYWRLNKHINKMPLADIEWQDMEYADEVLGHLCFHYASPTSALPVRGVDKKGDHKRDPNYETRTYGVFTDCNCRARRTCVNDGRRYIFFMTRFCGERRVVGYFEIAQYHEVTCLCAQRKSMALKAGAIRITDGIPMTGPYTVPTADDITADGIIGQGPPRGSAKLDQDATRKLRRLLRKQKRYTWKQLVSEVRSLERKNKEEYGYRYPSSKRRTTFSKKDIEGNIS